METDETRPLMGSEDEVDASLLESERDVVGFAAQRLSLELRPGEREAVVEVVQPTRSIGLWQLFVITFFVTCGGSFGLEPAVQQGGAALTIIGLAVIVGVWCLPQALMSAELALLCGSNGGAIVWADRAFGGLLSFLNMCNLLFSNLCSITLSLVLFARYFEQYLSAYSAEETFLIRVAVKFGVLLVSSGVVFLGPRVSSVISFAIGIILYIPFVCILIVLGIRGQLANADFGRIMADIPALGAVDYGIFISTLVWALGGFDSVGALAGEVKGGKSTYLKGVLLTIPASFVTYIGPALLCLIAVPQYSSPLWNGYTHLAGAITPWLGVLMTVCALLAMFGQCVAGISYVARQVWSCAVLGMLPSVFKFATLGKTGIHRPYVAVATVSVCMFGLAFISYDVLAVVFLLQRMVTLLFEYGALIRLRYLEPNAPRPFRVAWPWIWGLPTLIIGAFVLFFIKSSVIWIISGTLEGSFFVVFGLKYLFFRQLKGKRITILRLRQKEEFKPLVIQTA